MSHVYIPTIKNKPGNAKISGPCAAYSLTHEGKKYYFFSDIHYSNANNCPEPCEKMTNCFSLITLLTDILNRAESQDQWVDFYLEIPFLAKSIHKASPYWKNFSTTELLYRIYYNFWECFVKWSCSFSTTRFHYMDVRKIFRMTKDNITSAMTTYEKYLQGRIQKAVNKLEIMTKNKIWERCSYIEDTNYLIQMVYGTFLNQKLFLLYLESDNYITDTQNLTDIMLTDHKFSADNIIEIREHLYPSELIVYRNSKTMYRIRAQLYELSKENSDLAEKIKNFCIYEYNKRLNNAVIIRNWEQIMDLYWQKNLNIDLIGIYTREIYLQIIDTNAILMDAYTLARMFRNFKPRNSTRCIVVAGIDHILTYLTFFYQTFGNKIIEYNPNTVASENGSVDDVIRCVEINLDDFD